MSTGQGGIQSFLHEGPARSGDRVGAGFQSHRDLGVAPARARIGRVGLQQDTRRGLLARSVFAILHQRCQPLTLLFAEPNDELAASVLFRGHDVSLVVPERSIQTSAAKSMTRGTRTSWRQADNA